MKGTFFQKPLEFQVRIEGESWRQGDPIPVTLEVRNHGAEPVALSEVRLHLTYGTLKKVREKSPKAFDVIASGHFGGTLDPGKTATLTWKFETDRNFAITDVSGSPFIVYGRGEALETLGQLQLNFQPHALIDDLMNVFQAAFRFVVKSKKAGSKDTVEIKLAPPSGKAFSTLDFLQLSSKFTGPTKETWELGYTFNVKKVDASVGSASTHKAKLEHEQSFEPSQYRTASGRFDHERMEASVREALQKVESKIVF